MEVDDLELRDHDPAWVRFYEALRTEILHALSPFSAEVEHIGSTSVPGLLAKPIVDVGVVIPVECPFESCVAPLEALGFRYRGQNGDDPLRRYYVLEDAGVRQAQLHVWKESAAAWREALLFRDLLRERADLREAYERAKVKAVRESAGDKAVYSVLKAPFIVETLTQVTGRPPVQA